MGSTLIIQVYALLRCGISGYVIIPLLLRKVVLLGFFVKRQEHRGPEPWAMQTVGSIPLPQSTAYRSKLLI